MIAGVFIFHYSVFFAISLLISIAFRMILFSRRQIILKKINCFLISSSSLIPFFYYKTSDESIISTSLYLFSFLICTPVLTFCLIF